MTCVLLLVAAPAARAQGVTQGVTKEEERLAREAAAAFSERLLATRDFGPVVRELYAEDFMKHYFARVSERQGALKADPLTQKIEVKTFMLYGVPGLEFRTELMSRPDDEHWPRFYAAVSNLMLYTYLSLLTKASVLEWSKRGKLNERDFLSIYPDEAVRVLGKNRTTANFLRRKGEGSEVATPDDLRAATETLEEAARLTRPRLDEVLAAGRPQFSQNIELLKAASARSEVELAREGTVPVLYPRGTRIFKVFSPILYDLYLVNEGGRMKVAWATIPVTE